MYQVSVFWFFILLLVTVCTAQNCRTRGEWCSDTELCCGGCCIQQVCVDTYKDCRELEDPCDDALCPADSVCRIYKPKCKGCDIEKNCIFVDYPEAVNIDPGNDVIRAGANPLFGSHLTSKVVFISILLKIVL